MPNPLAEFYAALEDKGEHRKEPSGSGAVFNDKGELIGLSETHTPPQTNIRHIADEHAE